jgi:hypothetical protein
MQIVTTLDTFFKPGPEDSTKLPPEQMAHVKAGKAFPVLAYRVERGHVCFTLDPATNDLKALHPSGKNTWWAFSGAIEDPAGHGINNLPRDTAPPIVAATMPKGIPFKLRGHSSTFYSGEPMIPGGNFTWAEALHFNGNSYREPASEQVVDRLLVSARAMQEVRDLLGRPITINSWYRDPVTNKRAGGASQSRHMAGDAVDFRVNGMTPAQVFARLDPWWGNRGGLASSSVFTHLDCRGHRARWSYGF